MLLDALSLVAWALLEFFVNYPRVVFQFLWKVIKLIFNRFVRLLLLIVSLTAITMGANTNVIPSTIFNLSASILVIWILLEGVFAVRAVNSGISGFQFWLIN